MYTERQILAEAIAIIDEFGSVSTSELIDLLRDRMQPSGEDLDILSGRNDDKFSQKVRNLVSHRTLEKYTIAKKDDKGKNIFYSSRIVKNIDDIDNKEVREKLETKKKTARKFTARFIDYTKAQIENQKIGSLGEEFVYKLKVEEADEGDEVEHTSKERGDGTGYDISVFKEDGTYEYIEVKTTRGPRERAFYMSINEYEFYKLHLDNYVLARVYEYDEESKTASIDYFSGNDMDVHFEFEVNAYKVKFI